MDGGVCGRIFAPRTWIPRGAGQQGSGHEHLRGHYQEGSAVYTVRALLPLLAPFFCVGSVGLWQQQQQHLGVLEMGVLFVSKNISSFEILS